VQKVHSEFRAQSADRLAEIAASVFDVAFVGGEVGCEEGYWVFGDAEVEELCSFVLKEMERGQFR
jgi:hypothetical protein